jgi:hypothetical protein
MSSDLTLYSIDLTGNELNFNYRPRVRVTLQTLLSCYDVRIKLNPFLRKTDLVKLARCNKYMEEHVELMFNLYWYECPRISQYTMGSVENDHVIDTWDRLTFRGTLLPMSDGLHMKLLRSAHHRERLLDVQNHSRLWMNNEAFSRVIRLLGMFFIGSTRRDGDVFHDIANEMDMYFLKRRNSVRGTDRDTVSELRCTNVASHSVEEHAALLSANSEWWFRVVLRYLVAGIQQLRRPYEVQEGFTLQNAELVKLVDEKRLARIECFQDFLYAKAFFEIAEPLALSDLRNAFI